MRLVMVQERAVVPAVMAQARATSIPVRERGHGQHLPPGIRAPSAHHRAPVWSGHSWAVGEFFALSGFSGPYIHNWNDYGLPPAHPGTHWIYVDGWYLMVGNRTGRIIDEVPADY